MSVKHPDFGGERYHGDAPDRFADCDAGISGGCGACKKCDPLYWSKLALREMHEYLAMKQRAEKAEERIERALQIIDEAGIESCGVCCDVAEAWKGGK